MKECLSVLDTQPSCPESHRVDADADALEEVLTKNLEQTVDFYVYNTETDTVRITTIMPTLKWGGSGCLGAAIGHGYLHALPAKCCGTNGRSWKTMASESESPPMFDVRE